MRTPSLVNLYLFYMICSSCRASKQSYACMGVLFIALCVGCIKSRHLFPILWWLIVTLFLLNKIHIYSKKKYSGDYASCLGRRKVNFVHLPPEFVWAWARICTDALWALNKFTAQFAMDQLDSNFGPLSKHRRAAGSELRRTRAKRRGNYVKIIVLGFPAAHRHRLYITAPGCLAVSSPIRRPRCSLATFCSPFSVSRFASSISLLLEYPDPWIRRWWSIQLTIKLWINLSITLSFRESNPFWSILVWFFSARL